MLLQQNHCLALIVTHKNKGQYQVKCSSSLFCLLQAFLESTAVRAALNKTGSALAALTVLKKICDHPTLLNERAAGLVARAGNRRACRCSAACMVVSSVSSALPCARAVSKTGMVLSLRWSWSTSGGSLCNALCTGHLILPKSQCPAKLGGCAKLSHSLAFIAGGKLARVHAQSGNASEEEEEESWYDASEDVEEEPLQAAGSWWEQDNVDAADVEAHLLKDIHQKGMPLCYIMVFAAHQKNYHSLLPLAAHNGVCFQGA